MPYDALVSRYEETERRRDEVADAGQWAALVDSMTVHSKDKITFTLTSGMEIEAWMDCLRRR